MSHLVIFATSRAAARTYIATHGLPIQTRYITPFTLDAIRGLSLTRSDVVFVTWSTDPGQFSEGDLAMIESRIRE